MPPICVHVHLPNGTICVFDGFHLGFCCWTPGVFHPSSLRFTISIYAKERTGDVVLYSPYNVFTQSPLSLHDNGIHGVLVYLGENLKLTWSQARIFAIFF